MPVHCRLSLAKLSTGDFRDLDYRVMRHAYDSQNELGRLADERIYQADLAARLQSDGISVSREIEVDLSHRDYRKSLFLDLVVAKQAVYELKVVKALTDAHVGQLLTYLHLLDLPRGKLINYRPKKVESQFVNAPLDSEMRRSFCVKDIAFDGDSGFRDAIVTLLRDWGTSLTLSLYQEAVVFLLGGKALVEVMLPIHRSDALIGRQRFYLAAPDTAFKLTAMNRDTSSYQSQLARLIQYSPLRAIHWINIAHHEVTFITIPHSQ